MIVFYMPRLEVRDITSRLRPGFNILGSEEAFNENSQNSIVLEHETIDGKHAVLRFDPIKNTTAIMDLLSKGGILVDGEKLPTLEWRDLQHGQKIVFGRETATFLTEVGKECDVVGGKQSGSELDHSDVIPDDETQADISIENVTLPETQHRSRTVSVDELDKLSEQISQALDKSEKSIECIPDTQDVSEMDKTVQEHINLPETQFAKPCTQSSPRNLLNNLDVDDDWNYPTEPFTSMDKMLHAAVCDSQDLLGNALTEYSPRKLPERSQEAVVAKIVTKCEVSNQLIVHSDGDDTDCEDELVTAIEVKPPAKVASFLQPSLKIPRVNSLYDVETEPQNPSTAPTQPFVSIPRVNSLYDVETQPKHPSPAPETRFRLPEQPFVKIPRVNSLYDVETQLKEEPPAALPDASDAPHTVSTPLPFRTKESLDGTYLAATKINDNPIEGRNVASLMRLSDFSCAFTSDEMSQSSHASTPPCAINLPTGVAVANALKNKPAELKRKAAAPLLFPESDSEDDYVPLSDFKESPKMHKAQTPKKFISAATALRLKQICLLDSPDVFETQDDPVVTKAAKASAKKNLAKAPPEKPPKSPDPDPPLRRSKRQAKKTTNKEFEYEAHEEVAKKKPKKKLR